ncbi:MULTISPECIES: TRAP transporter substrate-binding protein DctP [unclassified Halomonas]|uniref:TRAP transporter substrate-binding protein DctP n=1 Tax=unclassified Halomonas TaxID=2609666 RepID=UPI000A5F9594|nr:MULTISPECIES: TRAP transporter substrate-binding protein DctP [unclassified Halomonas]MBT2786441.1 TRAP transporter substrate-binding protein DctP [Halomonas sp. ISL-106]MBT2797463.1 TRAP transporter substrate-binding protein DctP [Halomonas sp. ISL-104]
MKATIKTLIASVSIASSISSAIAADYTMRLAHQLPGSHHVAQAIEAFADEVKTNSNGRIEVQIFGGAQLYGPTEFHAAVARGHIEAASIVSLLWGGTIPEMQVFNIPYLMTGRHQLEQFPTSEAAAILDDKMASKGVKNLAWLLDANNAAFTSSDAPLIAPDDFQGTKIRGLSRVFDAGLIAMGASPATMPGSEVYQGLQTGVIDAAITSTDAVYSRRYFEVQDYAVASNLITVYQNIIVNPQWWESLPEDLQSLVESAASSTENVLLPETDEIDPTGIAKLEENNVEVTVLSDEQVDALRIAMQPAVEQAFIESANDGERLIELIKQL